MQKLKIEINSESGDFTNSLDEIKSQIDKGFFEGFDKNEDSNYSFKIN